MCSSSHPTSINDGLDWATAQDLRSLFGLSHLGSYILWIVIISFGLHTLGILCMTTCARMEIIIVSSGLSTLGIVFMNFCAAKRLKEIVLGGTSMCSVRPRALRCRLLIKGKLENCFFAKREEKVSNVSTWSLYAQCTHFKTRQTSSCFTLLVPPYPRSPLVVLLA